MALSPDRAREVGKLGGRPKGSVTEATKKKQEAQLQLRQMVEKEIKPITDALILKAKDGDVPAIKELFDRAWGKATQPIAGDSEAPPLRIEFAGGDTQKLLDIITK